MIFGSDISVLHTPILLTDSVHFLSRKPDRVIQISQFCFLSPSVVGRAASAALGYLPNARASV